MINQHSEQSLIWFDNLHELLDAAMLFGVQIEPGKGDSAQARIVASRGRGRWRALYWLITLLHRHRIDMDLISGAATTDRLVFASRFDRFFMPAARRWYGHRDGRRLVIAPESIDLTREMLVAWLVDAMAGSSPDQPVRLTVPWMSRRLAGRLRWRAARLSPLSPRIERGNQGCRLVLDPKQREAALAWLGQFVPTAVWDPIG